MQIDLIKLKIGKVIFTNYSKGDRPSVKEMDLNIEETFEDITSPSALVKAIVFKASVHTDLEDLAVLGLRNIAGDTLSSTIGVAAEAVGVVGDTLNKTTEKVRDIIELPLGTNE